MPLLNTQDTWYISFYPNICPDSVCAGVSSVHLQASLRIFISILQEEWRAHPSRDAAETGGRGRGIKDGYQRGLPQLQSNTWENDEMLTVAYMMIH